MANIDSKVHLKVLQPSQDENFTYVNPCTKAEAVSYTNDNFSNLTDTKQVLDYLLDQVKNISSGAAPTSYTSNANSCTQGNTFYKIKYNGSNIPTSGVSNTNNKDWTIWAVPGSNNTCTQFATLSGVTNAPTFKRVKTESGWEGWSKVLTTNECYPVGSLYFSLSKSVNPGEMFGGTWEMLSDERVLRVLNKNTTYSGNFAIGGSDSVKLTVKNLPPHKHLFPDENYTISWKENPLVGARSTTTVTRMENGNATSYLASSQSPSGKNGNLASRATSEVLFDENTVNWRQWDDTDSEKLKNLGAVRTVADQSSISTLPKWIGIYVWRRTA